MCRFKIIILTNQMVGSEFSINNMKAQIHRALHQQFQMLFVIFSWHTLGLLVTP